VPSRGRDAYVPISRETDPVAKAQRLAVVARRVREHQLAAAGFDDDPASLARLRDEGLDVDSMLAERRRRMAASDVKEGRPVDRPTTPTLPPGFGDDDDDALDRADELRT
jgi:hypothetical protein